MREDGACVREGEAWWRLCERVRRGVSERGEAGGRLGEGEAGGVALV
jgi:hypothetical protein